MAVQSTYSINHDQAYPGMPVDLQASNVTSKVNKGITVIPYGKGVVTDTETGALLPNPASTDVQFIGVAYRELNRATPDGGTFGAVSNRDFSIMTHGVIWVTATETVVKDDLVYLRVGATNTGDFGPSAGAGGATLSVIISNAKFLTGGAIGELVQVSLGIGG